MYSGTSPGNTQNPFLVSLLHNSTFLCFNTCSSRVDKIFFLLYDSNFFKVLTIEDYLVYRNFVFLPLFLLNE